MLHRDASPGMLQFAILCSKRVMAATIGGLGLESRGEPEGGEEPEGDDGEGVALDEIQVPDEKPKRRFMSQSVGRMGRRRSSRSQGPTVVPDEEFSRPEEVINLESDDPDERSWRAPAAPQLLRLGVHESRETVREHESTFSEADTFAAGDSLDEFERKSAMWRVFCARKTEALLEVACQTRVPVEGDIFRLDSAPEVSHLWYRRLRSIVRAPSPTHTRPQWMTKCTALLLRGKSSTQGSSAGYLRPLRDCR